MKSSLLVIMMPTLARVPRDAMHDLIAQAVDGVRLKPMIDGAVHMADLFGNRSLIENEAPPHGLALALHHFIGISGRDWWRANAHR